MQWLEWGADVFDRAARERKPVLLSIAAAWCAACHEMDATTYADPAVQAVIAERFVAVRVDSDRRPDINERYNLGGWPTTAFLTPAGDLLAGATFIPTDQMAGVLGRVADAFAAHGNWTPPRNQTAPVSVERPSEAEAIQEVFRTLDEEYGGFGTEPKFPITAPLHLALALARRDDARWTQAVERTLDAIAGGGLHDPQDGGYYRYATTREWQLPHKEKLLETNALLLGAFIDAAVTLGSDTGRVADLARFIRERMRSPFGGFGGSAGDPIPYMDSNAAAVAALLGAAAVLEDGDLARDALASFERVLLACYRPGAGVAHYFDGEARVRGLLADQVAAISTLLDAFDLTDDEPYRMMAEELAHFTIGRLWDARGGFLDRVPAVGDVGLLAEPQRPFVGNCDAARVLRRLGRVAGEPEFTARADAVLAVAGSVVAGQGPLAAHYVLALIEPTAG